MPVPILMVPVPPVAVGLAPQVPLDATVVYVTVAAAT